MGTAQTTDVVVYLIVFLVVSFTAVRAGREILGNTVPRADSGRIPILCLSAVLVAFLGASAFEGAEPLVWLGAVLVFLLAYVWLLLDVGCQG